MNKGQASFFIIVGVIILVIVAFAIAFLNTSNPTDNTQDIETEPIENYVESCLREVGSEGTYRAGSQGGYHDGHSGDIVAVEVPYYWVNGTEDIPAVSEIEFEISKYILYNIETCLFGLERFESEYEIETGNMSVKTKLNQEDTVYILKYPITLTKGDTQTTVEDFDARSKIGFLKAYEIMQDIMEEQRRYPNEVVLGYMNTLAYEEGFYLETVNIGHESVLHSMSFDFEERNEPFIFAYMARYDWDE